MAKGYSQPNRTLVSQQDSAVVPANDVPRSTFRVQWSHKKTFDAGLLYPFLCMEVLPGDHFKLRANPFVRTATPLFPIMDGMRIDTHFFFVPNRLVWTNWVRFMGEQPSAGDSIDFTIPQITSAGNGFAIGGLADHFELPTLGNPTAPLSVSALPFRMYQLIWNQWFRDENLQAAAANSTSDTANTEGQLSVLRRRAKSHDYFTSCLPAPQKFTAPNVLMPIEGFGIATAAIAPIGPSLVNVTETDRTTQYNYNQSAVDYIVQTDAAGLPQVFARQTVNAFRTAFLLQQYLEKDSRGGTRYTERNWNHFKVRSPDMRLQRAEYIGGGSTPLQFTPIAQTVPGAAPLGSLGAAGTAFGQHNASYASTEDGFIIGLISVKAELSYFQGIERQWDRRTRYDYYVPSTAGLGEQAVLRREIFALGTSANDDVVFGYQERWHELRTKVSRVTGLFRSTSTGNIDEWHLAESFGSAPVLGSTFIGDNPPMDRVLAGGGAEAGKQFLADILIQGDLTRPVPTYGVPAQLGRF